MTGHTKHRKRPPLFVLSILLSCGHLIAQPVLAKSLQPNAQFVEFDRDITIKDPTWPDGQRAPGTENLISGSEDVWQQAIRWVAETEAEQGPYYSWPLDSKVELVRNLIASGIAESGSITQMFEDDLSPSDAELLADSFLSSYTGWPASDINYFIFAMSEWGDLFDWSHEQRAWFSSLERELDLVGDDHSYYILPQGVISEKQAIEIARGEIEQAHTLSDGALDRYRVRTSFVVMDGTKDQKPLWRVVFDTNIEEKSDEQDNRVFEIYIDPTTGEVANTWGDGEQAAPQTTPELRTDGAFATPQIVLDAFNRYGIPGGNYSQDVSLIDDVQHFDEKYASFFPDASLEAKALWSRDFAPRVLAWAYYRDDGAYLGLLHRSVFVYGLPDKNAMKQSDALENALQILIDQFGYSPEEKPFFTEEAHVYYDITAPDKPLWKFLFFGPSQQTSNEAFVYYGEDSPYIPMHKIELDALTGDLVRAFIISYEEEDTPEKEISLY